MVSYKSQTGDTLVEVLVSMAVLSLVIVGSSMLVNSGLAQVRNAVEHTQVRNSLQQQSEYLHFLRDNPTEAKTPAPDNKDLWSVVGDANHASASTVRSSADSCSYGADNKLVITTAGKTAFYLKLDASNKLVLTDLASVESPNLVAEPGKGLWVQGVRTTPTTGPSFIDFYIQACWVGLGSLGLQQMGTVTRLYLP